MDINGTGAMCLHGKLLLAGDGGARVTVLHNGQIQQCSNCLRRADQGCPGQGNGKACEGLKTPRANMSAYMKSLHVKRGYMTLKAEYIVQQQRSFPVLGGGKVPGVYDNIEEKVKDDEEDDLETKIVDLEKTLAKAQTELRREKKVSIVAQNKLHKNSAIHKK